VSCDRTPHGDALAVQRCSSLRSNSPNRRDDTLTTRFGHCLENGVPKGDVPGSSADVCHMGRSLVV
jgi:hypothetical protein